MMLNSIIGGITENDIKFNVEKEQKVCINN